MHTDVAVSFAKRIQTGREGRTEANKDESAISLIRIAKLGGLDGPRRSSTESGRTCPSRRGTNLELLFV